jgi:hypothetical protein
MPFRKPGADAVRQIPGFFGQIAGDRSRISGDCSCRKPMYRNPSASVIPYASSTGAPKRFSNFVRTVGANAAEHERMNRGPL